MRSLALLGTGLAPGASCHAYCRPQSRPKYGGLYGKGEKSRNSMRGEASYEGGTKDITRRRRYGKGVGVRLAVHGSRVLARRAWAQGPQQYTVRRVAKDNVSDPAESHTCFELIHTYTQYSQPEHQHRIAAYGKH